MGLFAPKPHVSAALVELQRAVTVCAAVAFTCVLAQLVVFACAHFTEIRWTTVQPAQAEAQPRLDVVGGRQNAQAAQAQPAAASAAGTAPAPAAEPPRRVLGAWDGLLRQSSQLAATFGVMSTALLALFTTLGVVIAAAPGTPGVQRATAACAWAMVILAAALPWRDVMPSIPWPGVFGPYNAMVAGSEAVNAGRASSAALLAQHVMIPLVCGVLSLLVLARFRAGVADGVIMSSVNDLETRLEEEMADIRRRGVSSQNSMRAIAALNQAIGDRPGDAPPAPPVAGVLRPAPPTPELRPTGTVPAADDAPRPKRVL